MSTTAITQIMTAYAEDAVKHAFRHFGLTLDYTAASLDFVDAIVSRLAVYPEERGSSLTASEEAELWILSKMYGGYLGETIIRTVGAEWEEQNNEDGSSTPILFVAKRLRGRPPERLWKALTGDRFAGIVSYYRCLIHVLKMKDSEAPQ